jgi:2-C-methyl-D-erythritol 4-phosphate cytidylyltransferase
MTTAAAVVLAGGSGSRMGLGTNKVYLPVGGVPVLAWSLRTIAAHPAVKAIVVVNRPEDGPATSEVLASVPFEGPVAMVSGGSTRTGSEQAGLAWVSGAHARASFDVVLVHDGARPFVSRALLDALVEAADRDGGAIPATALAEPVYRADDDHLVLLDATGLRRVQTPQVFRTDALLAAYAAAAATGFEGFDTAQVVERFAPDVRVRAVPGDPDNIKVTTAGDLETAARLASRFVDGRWTG